MIIIDKSSSQDAKDLGLLEEEFIKIKKLMKRTPNIVELNIFSVMWSEHCSYKNSIKLLKTLPKKGKHIVAEAGEENAGLVSIDKDWACAFKIESHNHPSAIEPYQGAATGVGGINRDIFTTGARPIAQLNSLRFGNLENSKTKWLLENVVKGIGDYGNSFGVPTVGGEVYFEDCYDNNPLVNAFSAGIVNKKKIVSAKAKGIGNLVYIVGSKTGKDGIKGASFASKDLDDKSVEEIPSVQVGDPFQEKVLLEATLELIEKNCIVAMQDMGAAGIICSTSEMSAGGNCGMRIELDKVPLRQDNMTPLDILLSESQERMLIILEEEKENITKKVFDKWNLDASKIGIITDENNLNFYWEKKLIASIEPKHLVLGGNAPQYSRDSVEPKYFKEYKKFSLSSINEPNNLKDISKKIISMPNICSKNYIYQQYDSTIGNVNMSTNFPTSAATALIKDINKVLIFSLDCNSRYVHSNPYIGTMIAVCEAARNISCTGALPIAITNCLNFGNPYDTNVYWQFEESIKGMRDACNKLNTPVTGGNVSFYNQTLEKNNIAIPVFPTPVIGMMGIAQNPNKIMQMSFEKEGDLIYLLGKNVDDISCSQYLVNIHNVKNSTVPYFDIEEELNVQNTVREIISKKIISSANDISEGGLFASLIEKGIHKNLGFDIKCPDEFRKDSFLFGEAQSRIIISVNKLNQKKLEAITEKNKTPLLKLGTVTSANVSVNNQKWDNINQYKSLYNNSLNDKLNPK